MLQCSLTAKEGTFQVNTRDLIPQLFGRLHNISETVKYAGVVNDDVQFPKFIDSCLYQSFHLGLRTNICTYEYDLTAQSFDFCNRFSTGLRLDATDNCFYAGCGEVSRNGQANTGLSTGDNSYFTFQIKHHSPHVIKFSLIICARSR
ncbi:hypothetical protein PS862_01147 [Pseudomonas fluorescens]|uniref:Uncharacterized protein n=1 Tax=Pseudomonas fluorescens TaxID=294 RepID=A0A5E7HTQ2_PSEFL|nr:hypothetical protein PS862_01147 [Pseudomonas fluorescens]